MIRFAAAAALATCLAGCQTPGRPVVPASLLTCADAPAWKSGGTQRTVAGYVVDLREAHADCRDRLGAVRGLVERQP